MTTRAAGAAGGRRPRLARGGPLFIGQRLAVPGARPQRFSGGRAERGHQRHRDDSRLAQGGPVRVGGRGRDKVDLTLLAVAGERRERHAGPWGAHLLHAGQRQTRHPIPAVAVAVAGLVRAVPVAATARGERQQRRHRG
ncbi:MAG TPA: hypothetical protein VKZ89_09430 [Thermobifida alba]|nr:hypothetical protein [Thermobifida alba]